MSAETPATPAAPATASAAPVPAVPAVPAPSSAPAVPAPGAAPAAPAMTEPVSKPPEPAKAPTPADLVIKLPEGATVDPAVLKTFMEKATESGLTSKQAQTQVDFYLELNGKARQAQEEAFKAVDKKYVETLKADPEFGKDFDANLVIAQKPLLKYGSPELAKELVALGMQNHPGLTKFLHKVGKAMSEDSTARPQATDTKSADQTQEAYLRQRFPTMFPPG